mmetsp:Transcript_18481/g.70041  ORF Transcript_18481/g.70041 Transcript_18481/m.70041 type:complete len:266 (+) Transcript_18481:1456-2253(+)
MLWMLPRRPRPLMESFWPTEPASARPVESGTPSSALRPLPMSSSSPLRIAVKSPPAEARRMGRPRLDAVVTIAPDPPAAAAASNRGDWPHCWNGFIDPVVLVCPCLAPAEAVLLPRRLDPFASEAGAGRAPPPPAAPGFGPECATANWSASRCPSAMEFIDWSAPVPMLGLAGPKDADVGPAMRGAEMLCSPSLSSDEDSAGPTSSTSSDMFTRRPSGPCSAAFRFLRSRYRSTAAEWTALATARGTLKRILRMRRCSRVSFCAQ